MKTENDKTLSSVWGIKKQANGRYVIIDTISGNIIDNAQGYGFETYGKAFDYGYNKFKTRGECNGLPNIDEFNSLF